MYLLLHYCFYLIVAGAFVTANDSEESWNGGWFPHKPGTDGRNLHDPNHGIVMGVEDRSCDDGKTNVQIDWDFNPQNYTCFVFNRRTIFQPRSDIQPLYSQDVIPKGYSAQHRCMSKTIDYNTVIPTYGTHRPLWAKYGEYTFLPKQRWVHNLEHGAVVMLYHPCADQNQVNLLKKLVKTCLYRHVITPYNLLSAERPLALVAWGKRLEMSTVAPKIVTNFIRDNALKGPEQITRDGQYSLMLEHHAKIVSDLDDDELCKLYNYMK